MPSFTFEDFAAFVRGKFEEHSWSASKEIANAFNLSKKCSFMVSSMGAISLDNSVSPFDECIILFASTVRALLAKRFFEGFSLQMKSAEVFYSTVVPTCKEENWFLPIVYQLCFNVWKTAVQADEHNFTFSGKEKHKCLRLAGSCIVAYYRDFAGDAYTRPEVSKRIGMLKLTNILLRIYYELEQWDVMRPLVKAIDDSLDLWNSFSLSDKVCYNYITGSRSGCNFTLKQWTIERIHFAHTSKANALSRRSVSTNFGHSLDVLNCVTKRLAFISLLLDYCSIGMESDSHCESCHGFGLVEFNVHGKFETFEQVYIVGSVPSLGMWKTEDSVRLTKQPSSSGDIWTVRLLLPVDTRIEYRLFTAFSNETFNHGRKTYIAILRWEAFDAPRQLLVMRSQSLTNITCAFGANGNDTEILKDGWLTEQYEVRLMIYGRFVRFYKEQFRSVGMKISASVLDFSNDANATSTSPFKPSSPCYISVLTSEDSEFKRTCDKVVPFESEDVLIVKKQCFIGNELAFKLEFFPAATVPSTEANLESIGSAVHFTSAMRDNFGYSVLPITDRSQMVVGEIGVQYLVIKPMAHNGPDFPTTVDRIEFKTPLNIGHRGMGNSYTKFAPKRENTISSFRQAASCGAEYVEFDVQLTKDEIPIVFHDFHVRLLAKRRRKGASSPTIGPSSDWEMHTVMLNSLRLEELRSLKIEHAKSESNFLRGYSSVTNDNEPIDEDQPFPTLEQVFKSLPPSLGFNIEIKYPQKMESQQDPEGAQHAMERNLYMDRILEVVLKLADQRNVIFSSFDPEICLMIQLKQNKYPVLFLTQGDSKRYERYADVRMQSSRIAIHFARSNGLLGVAFHSEEILRDASLLPLARSLHLTSFVWGNDLDSAQMVEHFRKLGFDGVIYDQMDRFHSVGNETCP
ncbi:hypothetical protein M514_03854 [Trichuris suis]|uniref:Glycerophosphodiester phosphodiesterase family protein n=1 Tax=Trichuris suis TaxID=68888 RepID=A0A085N7L7_9BILA|nr:hypothetical protein M514_03854 [Trichuris suis]